MWKGAGAIRPFFASGEIGTIWGLTRVWLGTIEEIGTIWLQTFGTM